VKLIVERIAVNYDKAFVIADFSDAQIYKLLVAMFFEAKKTPKYERISGYKVCRAMKTAKREVKQIGD
jgi:uncharacterized protein YktA (UPF0223 family)